MEGADLRGLVFFRLEECMQEWSLSGVVNAYFTVEPFGQLHMELAFCKPFGARARARAAPAPPCASCSCLGSLARLRQHARFSGPPAADVGDTGRCARSLAVPCHETCH